jgi:hypothetical protein
MTMSEQKVEETGRNGVPLEVDPDLVETVSDLMEKGERGMVLNLVADLYAADQAQLLSHLREEEASTLLKWLTSDQAGEVLAELDDPELRAMGFQSIPIVNVENACCSSSVIWRRSVHDRLESRLSKALPEG